MSYLPTLVRKRWKKKRHSIKRQDPFSFFRDIRKVSNREGSITKKTGEQTECKSYGENYNVS